MNAPSHLPLSGRLRILAVLLAGSVLSLTGFFFTREAYRRQVEAQFGAAARDRAESVIRGFHRGFEDVLVLRGYCEASGCVGRRDFDAFLAPILARHPFIQAFQWLPVVTPANRANLESEARLTYPAFRFFKRDEAGNDVEMPRQASFHAVFFVVPYQGNEVSLGFSTEVQGLPVEVLSVRQKALARAIRTGELSASGGIRLLQETGDQTGMLVLVPVRGKEGQPLGMAQGVFRMGALVHNATIFLEPRGLSLRLLDVTDGVGSLMHEEPSPLPAIGPGRSEGLSLARSFERAGRRWRVEVAPAGGDFAMGTPWRAWAVLIGGLAFSILLASYVRTLLANEIQIRTQVEARTLELSREMASHRLDTLARRESEARFRQLIEVMGEGLWVLDAQGLTTFVNRRMAEMLGHAPADMVGRSLFEFMAEEDTAAEKQHLSDRLEGHSAQHDFRFRRKDGGDLWTIVTSTPVLNEEGQVLSVLGVITDITERRRQEQALLQSQKLESLGVLAGGIAHDFNNLLTTILGNLNMAQLSLPESSPALPYLDTMERTVQRATNLTRQMLAYSGKGSFVVGPLDLNQVVQEMSHLLSVSISKKVALRFQLRGSLPVLMGEASQIQQVIMNLVTNASEAIGDAEGTVCIRTGLQKFNQTELLLDFPGQPIEPGTYLTLDVSDTGQGMAPEVLARIFEPFFTTKFTGRGLGLSAMQGIVRGHRGGIRVISELGKGSTFKLIFPVGAGEAMERDDPIAEPDWAGSGTILVVDDEEGVRSVAGDLLRSMGFEVILAADGLKALECFRESPIPIRAVLMDLTMPHLGGLETFRELRCLDPDCRVVLTSGYNEHEAIQDFLGKGLAAFVQKPFLRADLMRGMRRALEG